MESSIFFRTQKGNQYLYDRNLSCLLNVSPVMEQIYRLDSDSETDYQILRSKILRESMSMPDKIDYEIRHYLHLKTNGFFGSFDAKKLIAARLTPKLVEQQLSSLRTILFQVTNKCNLRCKYCCYGDFYENKSRPQHLDETVVNKVFDYMLPYWVAQKASDFQSVIRIGFYGGEPLFNFPLVRHIMEVCEKMKQSHSLKFLYSMTTNAVLLDKYMDFLVANDVTLLLSLDGNKTHNYLRVDANGKESFEKVYQNIKKLQHTYPEYFDRKVDINSVLNNQSGADEVQAFILSEFGKQPTVSSISFTGIKAEHREDVKKIYKDYEESTETLVARGTKSPYWSELGYFLFSQFGNSFKHYYEIFGKKKIERKYPTGTCLPFMKKMFVTAEGDLLPCERICHHYVLGKVTDKVYIDCEQIANMYNQYYEDMTKQCSECYHIHECKKCFMQSECIDSHPVCHSRMNKQQYRDYLSSLVSLLEENPNLFKELNQMIFA